MQALPNMVTFLASDKRKPPVDEVGANIQNNFGLFYFIC
jgi:hypothetical protein